jgi:hypothetical protein
MYKIRNYADPDYELKVIQEAEKFGLVPVFSSAMKSFNLGIDPTKAYADARAFAELKDGQGKPIIKERANGNERPTLDTLFILSNSVSNQVARLGGTALQEFHEKALAHAIRQVNVYLDLTLQARIGADGLDRAPAKTVSVAVTNVAARDGSFNLHVHHYLLDRGIVAEKGLRTLDTRPLFDSRIQQRVNSIFQHSLAVECEKSLGWKMDIDKRGSAIVQGIPNTKKSERREKAEEYLKERGKPRDN